MTGELCPRQIQFVKHGPPGSCAKLKVVLMTAGHASILDTVKWGGGGGFRVLSCQLLSDEAAQALQILAVQLDVVVSRPLHPQRLHRFGAALEQARPWEKSMTSSSVPWMMSTGDVILDTFSMLKRWKTENKNDFKESSYHIRSPPHK
ncbi:hypothetical protein F7725_027477 [Dissostichus mawsoni]|uniref:Uncharacterized protein n=1 Tax=Dissostichus mawsoni TaxID=36200 RepID=A0A7J5XDX7_DISMA|nr:hypothetical protein F7725_027477 [Dissostichus mawsoni]